MKSDCGLCRKWGRGCHYHPDDDVVDSDPTPGRRNAHLADPSRVNDQPQEGKCNGKLRGGRIGLCRQPAGWGTDHLGYGHCKKHLGNAPNHVKAAKKAMALAEVTRLGLPLDVSPHQALLMAVQASAGIFAYLRARVTELEEEDVTWGMTREEVRTGGDNPGTTTVYESKPNIWYVMLREAQRDMVNAAAAAAKAGVEERAIKLAEGQAQMIADAVRGIVTALSKMFGFDSSDPRVAKVVRGQLMAVSDSAKAA